MKTREAVAKIDEAIKAAMTDQRWNIKQFGLGKIVVRSDRENKRFPVITTPHVKEDAIIDDRYTLVTYHISNGTSYNSFEGFGNDEDDIERVDTLTMIVYSSIDRTRTTQEELIDIITNLIPNRIELGIDGLFSQIVDLKSVNDNSLALFNSQYSGSDITLPADSAFFGVQYTITSNYTSTCLDSCSTC